MAGRAKRALLLDLDDTLLLNDMEAFAPHYFHALLAKAKERFSPGPFLAALDAGTQAMWRNDGNDGTNAEVFWSVFCARTGRERDQVLPLFDAFYTQEFETLRQYTGVDPQARVLVELALKRGYQVAVATQPVFPLTAILARLRWAGVGAELFDYHFIASYETMRACKPHPHYFASILSHLGRAPEECLMVGDSPSSDMAAGQFGLATFWVDRGQLAEDRVRCDARGDLGDLLELIQTGRIDDL